MTYPPKPMFAAPGSGYHTRLIANPGWVCEPKHDGVRVLVRGGEYTTRQGNPVTHDWLPVVPGDVVLDGEMVGERRGGPEQTVWWFDIPSHPGTLDQRRAALVDLANHHGLRVVPWLQAEGALERVLAAGGEGVVFKQRSSLYHWQARPENKVPCWVKVKP